MTFPNNSTTPSDSSTLQDCEVFYLLFVDAGTWERLWFTGMRVLQELRAWWTLLPTQVKHTFIHILRGCTATCFLDSYSLSGPSTFFSFTCLRYIPNSLSSCLSTYGDFKANAPLQLHFFDRLRWHLLLGPCVESDTSRRPGMRRQARSLWVR